MNLTRRDVLGTLLAGALVIRAPAERTDEVPTTDEIREYLLSKSPWVDREHTVDTVKVGDPAREVRKCAVCWYPSVWDIRAAIAARCDLLITHEPTFWEHAPEESYWRDRGPGTAKSRLLADSGLVVLRAHDTWDNWPDLGIRDSWARFLQLGKLIQEGSSLRWTALYEVPEQTLSEFARHVASRVRELGEEGVQVMGERAHGSPRGGRRGLRGA